MSGVAKKLMSAFSGVAGPVEAQAVDFDGTNDYLSRSTDLVGNTDSKTFTFSAWVYIPESGGFEYVYANKDATHNQQFVVFVNSSGGVGVQGWNAAGGAILDAQSQNFRVAINTWVNILISVDLANTANRYFAINDVVETSPIWNTYTNNTIDFTTAEHFLAKDNGTNSAKSRLSNVFLDYTYRDLSVEANRRLFITDEGTPASGQASLNPILYLPMDDPADVGRNDGTGGNFTLNGIVARSGRGPNQYNAAASTFDGTADYLIRNPVTGMSDSKVLNVSFNFKMQTPSAGDIFTLYNSGGVKTFQVGIDFFGGSWRLYLIGRSSGAEILFAEVGLSRNFVNDKWQSYSISLDMANTSNRLIQIDGVDYTSQVTWHTYTNALFNLDGKSEVMREGSNYVGGELSDLWFNTTYIDLSADNPFYDTETDKPKFLGEFGELPTGSAPLIYLPLRADDAGNNKGTGGDFTVNSGPYVGARGPSEFWGDAAEFNGTNQSLSRTSTLTGSADGKVVTFVGAFKLDATASRTLLLLRDEGLSQARFSVEISTTGFEITARTSANTSVLFVDGTWSGNTTDWHTIAISFDFSNASNRHIYINGTSISGSYSTYSDLSAGFSANGQRIARNNATNYLDGKIGFLWFNTEYTDFSQEANRLKFFDAFGFPVDLGEDGSLPTGNVPLIYMNEDFHLGTNYGSGGNFTPVNAPTDGGYVKG